MSAIDLLVRLYPRDFRERYGAQMRAFHRARLDDAGPLAWFYVVPDHLTSAAAEHMTTFVQDLRHAARSLRRTPVFAVTAITTLALGVGATAAIFSLVNGVLLRPLPYPNADRLVGVWHDLPGVGLTHVQQTSSTYFTYRKLARTIEDIGVYQTGAGNVSEPGGATAPQRLQVARISASVLPTLEVRPVLGRNFSDAEDLPHGPTAVIISDALWRTRFGADPSVIGRRLEVNGIGREIVGIAPPGFAFPRADVSLWLPLGLDPNEAFPGSFQYDVVARLRPGITAPVAQRDLASVLLRLPEVAPNFAPGVTSQQLLDRVKPVTVVIPLQQDMTAGVAGTLWMIAVAVSLVLLVACANVTNLVLVRADARQRELAVREALGAGRSRILGHFVAEATVLAIAAAVIGFGAATVAIRTLVSSGAASDAIAIPRLAEVAMDWQSALFTLGVAAFAALACTVIPALRLGRQALSQSLREGGRGGTAGKAQHRVRAALVAAQIALALVVLAGSALLLRTYRSLTAVRPGFDAHGVATLWVSAPEGRYPSDSAVVRFYDELTRRIAQLPGVTDVGITSRLPLEDRGTNKVPLFPEEGPESANQEMPPLQMSATVSGDYFRSLGIPLVAGRSFTEPATQSPLEAVVSARTAEQFWHDSTGRAAVGKRFRLLPSGPLVTVVGVAGTMRDTSLAGAPVSAIYFPQTFPLSKDNSAVSRTMSIVVRGAGDPTTLIPAVQRSVRELDTTLPTFDARPMAEVMSGSMARLSFIIVILAAAALVTLALGAVGLYGVMAYVVTLRTRELGVRLALGARPATIGAMMTRQALGLTATGIVAGLALFILVARFLRAWLFGVSTSDPLALGAASVMLLGIAALAAWIPARRAARVDPAITLRTE